MKTRNPLFLVLTSLTISLASLLPAVAQVAVSLNVNGQGQTGGAAPPDPNAAVGPNHVVEYVNDNSISIYNKSGGFISQIFMNSFFGTTTGGDGHVIYDEISGRFALEILGTLNSSGVGTVLFAVSDTSDPTGTWHKTTINVPGLWDGYGGNGIGYNADAYVVHVNGFNNQFAVIAASNNVSLAYTLVTNTPTAIRVGRPVPMPGSTTGSPFYFVEGNDDGANSTGGRAGYLEVVTVFNILSTNRTFADYPVYVDGVWTSVVNTSWRSNQLAAVGQVQVGASNPNTLRWYLLDTSSGMSLLQNGTPVTPPDGGSVGDPSIAIGPNGSLGVNFVSWGAPYADDISMYVAGRAATDPAGVMRPSLQVKTSPISDGRYGDYSSCVVDINSSGLAQNTFWACNEFLTAPGQFNWGTRLANFSIPLGMFAPAPTGLTPVSGNTQASLSWTASSGATSYNVKRAVIDSGPYTIVGTPSDTNFVNTGLNNGTTYYYVVSAVNGSGEGANSAQVSVIPQGSTATVFGFETPSIGSGNRYNPLGGPWTFSGASPNGSGIIANGSAFGNPAAPEGVQAAFVQEYGTVSQTLSGFVPGTNYTITYSAAQRSGNAQTWNVTIDGTVIKSNTPSSSSYTTMTANFTASAGTHTLAFVGTDIATGDNTVFIDNVKIVPPLGPPSAVPMGLAATAANTQVNLSWDAVPGAVNYNVKRATVSGGPYSTVANVTLTNFMDTGLTSGTTYYYVVSDLNLGGESTNSSEVSVTTLPLPWVSADVGSVGANGSVIDSNGVFTVNGSGADIWGTADAFQFVYQTVSGDCDIRARAASLANTSAGAKAGVMIRATLDADSAEALADVQPAGSGLQFIYRTTPGGSAALNSSAGGSAPVWVRLTRTNSTITAYYSADGTSWTSLGPQTITMPSTFYVGLAVCSHNDGVICAGVLDNVTLLQAPPSVALISPANNTVFSAANPINLAAAVTTNGTTIVGVQFYANTSNLIAQVVSPYTYAWSNANAGASTVFARLVFNGSNTVDSSVVNITVTNPPPIASGIGLGADGQTLTVSGIGLANRPYYLNVASNLTPPVVWSPIWTNLSDGAGNISFTNIAPTYNQEFFNISAP